jgi:hypothetical protein
MAKTERVHETVEGPLDPEYIRQRTAAGWKLVGLEWEREDEAERLERRAGFEQVPFGLKVANDCRHLVEDSEEMQVLKSLMEMIVQDISLGRMADELNLRSLRMRDGNPWNPVAVFKVLPRVIEAGPKILSSEEWVSRRKQIARVTWNS